MSIEQYEHLVFDQTKDDVTRIYILCENIEKYVTHEEEYNRPYRLLLTKLCPDCRACANEWRKYDWKKELHPFWSKMNKDIEYTQKLEEKFNVENKEKLR